MKFSPNAARPQVIPIRLPPTTVRERKSRSGTSGADDLFSTSTNKANSADDRSASSVVRPAEDVGASITAYTRTIRAAVKVTAPVKSNPRRPGPRLSVSSTGASATTSKQTGTLMKKIHSQPSPSVTGPPISDPAVPPTPLVAPQIPSALLRSAPSGKVVITIDSALGASTAAA